MKIIGEVYGDEIQGSFVREAAEYGITGKVLNRDPLELVLTLLPKTPGQRVTIRVKCEASPTLYAVTAHVISSMEITMRAKIEMEHNFTDVYFKVSFHLMFIKIVIFCFCLLKYCY